MTRFTLILLLVFLQKIVIAQKPPLNHQVYDSWQDLTTSKISNNGKWVAYVIAPQAGDAKLYVHDRRMINKSTEFQRPGNFEFTADGNYIVYMIKPLFRESRTAKIKKKKADEMPKDSLGILSLNTMALTKTARVKSFVLPKKSSNIVVYQLENEVADTIKKLNKQNDDHVFYADETSPTIKKDGSTLVIKDLKTLSEVVIKSTTEFGLSEDGRYVAYACIPPKKDTTNVAGMYIYDSLTKQHKQVLKGKGDFRNITFDEQNQKMAFTYDKSAEKALVKFPQLYLYNLAADSAKVLVTENSNGMINNFSVSENGKIFFSNDGRRLFFGTAPIPAPKDTTLVDFENAKVDIWSYTDEDLQPVQLVNLSKKLKENFTALYDFDANKMIQLTQPELSSIILPEKGLNQFALGVTDFGNRKAVQWEGAALQSAYSIDLNSGKSQLVNKNSRANYQLSPKGNFVAWFDRKQQLWYLFNNQTATKTALKLPADIKFYDEENDVPDDASDYGLAGFSTDETKIYIYDRYDIWIFNTTNGVGSNFTNGFGRANKLTFRILALDSETKSIKTDGDLILSAFSQINKQNGFFSKIANKNSNPLQLQMGKYNLSKPLKAKYSDAIVYEKSSFISSTNLFFTTNWKKDIQLSSTNMQQKDYNWGTAELFKWTTPKGYSAEGILYKPEDFDSSKKYPMIVYFYEKLSDGLFNYHAPAPTPSRLNISYFVSNGYLVFAPDISYEIGHPGRSAEEFINSGVDALKNYEWVNGQKIGIQGQSWGGYQVAHLITTTDRYAAAWAGAPVVNMFSAYGGIRWGTGLNRQFQYEKTQSRIGATIWEKPELYMENSPLFKMPNVKTPVVIMANDADGAVPWYQGIEMFTALRRLGKPVWMLNYNGDDHNLVKRENRKDIQIREQQFFDHYLKDKPAPKWMISGVPAILKGKDWGLEIPKK